MYRPGMMLKSIYGILLVKVSQYQPYNIPDNQFRATVVHDDTGEYKSSDIYDTWIKGKWKEVSKTEEVTE